MYSELTTAMHNSINKAKAMVSFNGVTEWAALCLYYLHDAHVWCREELTAILLNVLAKKKAEQSSSNPQTE